MTAAALAADTRPGSLARSIGAVIAGFVAIFVLSLAVDQVFHVLGVYPAWGEPMRETSDNALALSYRLVIDVFGCWLCARLAPRRPTKHALVLGALGFVLSSFAAVMLIPMDLGPAWYPIALALSSLPCAWLGGRLAAGGRG